MMSEVFGTDFDDDLFAVDKPAREESTDGYQPKQCPEGWFYTASLDPPTELGVRKFRGDLSYQKGDYSDAYRHYMGLLQAVPSSNLSVTRDTLEALARCSLKLGKPEEAFKHAVALHKTSKTQDHMTVSHSLLVKAYSSLGQSEMELESHMVLVNLHCYNDVIWSNLGDCLSSIKLTCECDTCPQMAAVAAWSRSVLILESVSGTVLSFVRSRNDSARKRLCKQIEQTGCTNKFIVRCREVMGNDIGGRNSEVTDSEFKDLGSSKMKEQELQCEGEAIQRKWFKWILEEGWCCDHVPWKDY